MQFVRLVLSKQFKFSRRHCDFCVNSEHFHQDCFSCKLLGSWWHVYCLWSLEMPSVCNFLNTGAEMVFITLFSSLFLKKEDTMQRDQHILTFLLCFCAKISHVRENSLLAWFPFSPPLLIEISPQVTSWINQLCSQLWENSLTRWVSSPGPPKCMKTHDSWPNTSACTEKGTITHSETELISLHKLHLVIAT